MIIATPQKDLPVALSYDQLTAELAITRRQLQEALEDKAGLEELVRHLKRLRFGPKSEIYSPGQGTLFDEAEVYSVVEVEESVEPPPTKKSKKKRGTPKRRPLPSTLPRTVKILDLPDDQKVCPRSGLPLKKLSDEVSEQLDIKPAELSVIETRRPKYVCDCPECKSGLDTPTIKIAPVEPQPIPKSMAGPGVLAYIAVSKYADALPLARQETIFKRHGIELSRSTMASWMISVGNLIRPLLNLARDELVKAKVVQADETRIQIHKGTGKDPTADSYMWVFLANGPNNEKIILYELGSSRSHTVPLRMLEGFCGYLHTDGYEAYETLAAKMPNITLVGDWAHVRRKFDEAIKAVAKDCKGEIKAKVAFDLINELFRIEREQVGDDASLEKRRQIREELSRPIIDALKKWADETQPTLPPKTLTGIAVRYMLERWSKLVLFLEDPILRLDTNPVEGAIRPFVVGRNNWQFSDSLKGAEASAGLYSLIVMARANGLNPFTYLKEVFTELPKAKTIEDIQALLPWAWKPISQLN
jgi:transposase